MSIWFGGCQVGDGPICWGTGSRRNMVHLCRQFAGQGRGVVGSEGGPQVSWLKDLGLDFQSDRVSKLLVGGDDARGEDKLVVDEHWGVLMPWVRTFTVPPWVTGVDTER